MTLKYTPIGEIAQIHVRLSATFHSGATRSLDNRRKQLLQLAHLMKDNRDALTKSIHDDLGRHKLEVMMPEIGAVISACLFATQSLTAWTSPEKPEVEDWKRPFDATIYAVPKGVVAIIGPWNYPYAINLLPLVGAIAAGCTAVVKPSEYTPVTSQLLADLFPRYLDPNAFAIINGAEAETTRLLELKWNHIFFTGSGRVGRIVATAAIKHLTPVTLELGSKSPVFVDGGNTDLMLAAKRILWGKQQNAGQVCVAPDYVLVPRQYQAELVAAFQAAYGSFWPHPLGALDSASEIGHIVNEAHYSRLVALIKDTKGNITTGGKASDGLRIEPTIVSDVTLDDILMQDEIFGPILPIVPVADVNEAISIIQERPTPLVIYAFTDSEGTKQQFLDSTSSGQLVLNDTFQQLAVHEVPFGGFGDSGYGSYLGKHSFNTFIHKRGYINVPLAAEPYLQLRYPPYTEQAYGIFSTPATMPIPDV